MGQSYVIYHYLSCPSYHSYTNMSPPTQTYIHHTPSSTPYPHSIYSHALTYTHIALSYTPHTPSNTTYTPHTRTAALARGSSLKQQGVDRANSMKNQSMKGKDSLQLAASNKVITPYYYTVLYPVTHPIITPLHTL